MDLDSKQSASAQDYISKEKSSEGGHRSSLLENTNNEQLDSITAAVFGSVWFFVER